MTCARATASAAVASTCATAQHASVSTAGTGRRVQRRETAASSTSTASVTGAPTPTARDASSAASAPTSCRTERPTRYGHLLLQRVNRPPTDSDQTYHTTPHSNIHRVPEKKPFAADAESVSERMFKIG